MKNIKQFVSIRQKANNISRGDIRLNSMISSMSSSIKKYSFQTLPIHLIISSNPWPVYYGYHSEKYVKFISTYSHELFQLSDIPIGGCGLMLNRRTFIQKNSIKRWREMHR